MRRRTEARWALIPLCKSGAHSENSENGVPAEKLCRSLAYAKDTKCPSQTASRSAYSLPNCCLKRSMASIDSQQSTVAYVGAPLRSLSSVVPPWPFAREKASPNRHRHNNDFQTHPAVPLSHDMSKWFESYHHACGFLSFLRRNGEAARPCGIDDDLIPNSDLGVQSFIETVRISRKAGRASLLGGLHQQFTPDPI